MKPPMGTLERLVIGSRGAPALPFRAIFALLAIPVSAAGQDSSIAFVHVAVIPMDREQIIPDQTVIVRGDRIAALGPSATLPVPAGAVTVAGRGHYLIPGLADMHAHGLGTGDPFPYLANGVTTVRDMHSGGPSEATSPALRARRLVAQDALLGPRIYTAGDIDFNWRDTAGKLTSRNRLVSKETPDTSALRVAADSVRLLKAAGHDFLKLYAWPRPLYDSVIRAARQVGLRVVGHVPQDVGIAGVLRDHWASIEHLGGTASYFDAVLGAHPADPRVWRDPRMLDVFTVLTGARLADTLLVQNPHLRLDPQRLRRLARATRQAGVWNCPTLTVTLFAGPAGVPPLSADSQALPQLRALVHAIPYASAFGDSTAPLAIFWLLREQQFKYQIVRALHDAGAGLLLGTDGTASDAWRVPEELRLLVEGAGLTPYEALRTGTRNVAEFLGTLDSTGTIAVGKRADLVLLEGNPLQDIRYAAGPAGVMVGGRWLPRRVLETRLAGLEDSAGRAQRLRVWNRQSVSELPRAGRAADSVGATTVGHSVARLVAPRRVPFAVQHVTVVDIADGQLRPEQTLLVVGRHIRAVGPTGSVRLPRGARVIDAGGRYLIPGLWDMHVHTLADADVLYPYFITRGVTGVREMNSPFLDSLRQWRREIAAGTRVGPRTVITGGMFSSPREFKVTLPGVPNERLKLVATTPAQARHVVDSLKAAGVDFLKVHAEDIPRAIFFAAAAEARRVGMPVAGHLLDSLTPAEASDSGQRSIEHVTLDACRPGRTTGALFTPPDSVARAACAAMAARFRRNDTWLDNAGGESPLCPDTSHHVGPYDDSIFGDGVRLCAAQPAAPAESWTVLPLLAGTDFTFGVSPAAKLMPVFQQEVLDRYELQQTLARFVASGLTPLAALRTATLNPARFFHATDSLGTIAQGKLADLVLLDGNPLADIWNTTVIRAVVANGRYYDRAALDALIANLARNASERTAQAKARAHPDPSPP